jgi:PPOX class probable F420-dependent enzyme
VSRAMTPEEIRAFLDEGARTAALATVGPDGAPHVVPVWYLRDGDDLVITTASASVKARNVASEPRVALTVDEERLPLSFVSVRGTARLEQDPPDLLDWTTRIARRYDPEHAEETGRRNAALDDTLVRVRIEKAVGIADLAAPDHPHP